MTRSGYVVAGFETLATILKNFWENPERRWNDNFSKEDISKFLSTTCAGFLHSYGQNFGGKKKYDKYDLTENKVYDRCREWGFFDDCKFVADSGGFQISVGRLTKEESLLLIEKYYDWLKKGPDVQRAFILDIPPGPGCKIFDSFKDVYEWNLESYNVAKNLPDEVRNKIIYVHHFRTPKLWDIYTKILRENDMFRHFEYHGTGGIVANMTSDMIIPCFIYVIPLVPLLNEAIRHGRDHLNFHILGGANFRDVMFYEFIKIAVMKEHGIKLNVTYDSSGLFKSFMIGRYLWVWHPHGHLQKMDVRTPNIDKRFCDDIKVCQQYQILMDEFADKMGFKRINLDPIYSPDTGTFFEDIKVYSMLYMLDQWADIQDDMRKFAEETYPIYESGHENEFVMKIYEMIKGLNSGKITKKTTSKSRSIPVSIDIVKRLDEDYCKYIVDKYLSKDEFIGLDETTKVLTI
jgi:hypothetical protein